MSLLPLNFLHFLFSYMSSQVLPFRTQFKPMTPTRCSNHLVCSNVHSMKFKDLYLAVKALYLLLPTPAYITLAYLQTSESLHLSYPVPWCPIMMAVHAFAHLILPMAQPGNPFKSILVDLAAKVHYQTAFSCLPFAGIKPVARGISLRVIFFPIENLSLSRKSHFSYCQETVKYIVTDSSPILRLHSVTIQCGAIGTPLY